MSGSVEVNVVQVNVKEQKYRMRSFLQLLRDSRVRLCRIDNQLCMEVANHVVRFRLRRSQVTCVAPELTNERQGLLSFFQIKGNARNIKRGEVDF